MYAITPSSSEPSPLPCLSGRTGGEPIDYHEAFGLAVTAAGTVLRGATPLGISSEDVAQESLIKLFQRNPDEMDNWRGWVRRVARNAAVDAVRKGQLYASAPTPDNDDELDGLVTGARTLRSYGPSAAAMYEAVVDGIVRYLSATDAGLIRSLLDGSVAEDLVAEGRYGNVASARAAIARARQNVQIKVPAEELAALLRPVRLY